MRVTWPARLGWRHVCEHVASLHVAPLLLSLLAAMVVWACCGVHVLWCVLLVLCGVCCVVVMWWVQPLPSLAPAGGQHHVGLCELHADVAHGVPPVTVFYPTSDPPPPSRARRVRWLPFDDTRYLRGLAAYARVPYLLVRDLRLVRVCVTADGTPLPLFDPDTGAPRPLFVFSHGLSAFARTYTTLLMNLAARGALVFAMTHMDGSAAFCRDAGDAVCVPFAAALPFTPAVREPQLRQRVAETRNTLAQLRCGALLRALHYSDDDIARYLRASPALTLVGHSFGGATVLAAMATHASDKDASYNKDTLATATTARSEDDTDGTAATTLRVGAVVAFDPWHMPLEGELFYAAIRDDRARYTTPTLMLHSEEWVRYEESWQFVHKLCTALAAQSLTTDEVAYLSAAARKMRTQCVCSSSSSSNSKSNDDSNNSSSISIRINSSQKDERDDKSSIVSCGNNSRNMDENNKDDNNNNNNNVVDKSNGDDDEASADSNKNNMGWVDVQQCTSTGHRTCTDVALLSPVVSVPKYMTAPSAVQMERWAEQSLQFAQLHAIAASN